MQDSRNNILLKVFCTDGNYLEFQMSRLSQKFYILTTDNYRLEKAPLQYFK